MNCKNCDKSKHIVNKHFNLCQECNNMRLHGSKYGKAIDNTQKERKSSRLFQKDTEDTDTPRMNHKLFDNIRTKHKIDKGIVLIQGGRNSGKSLTMKILMDEQFYELCFKLSNHKCEECGTQLPKTFRDENNKIIARWRYSHVIPKSIAPELRHVIENINHLCIDCHGEWDFGDKVLMKIYRKNKKRFPRFLS